jgi:hypothetical protein
LPGVAFSGTSGPDRSAPSGVGQIRSGSVFEGAQPFIAGWSSPVARQAHNLKVIGSNPIPATKLTAGHSASLKAALPGGFRVSAWMPQRSLPPEVVSLYRIFPLATKRD